MIFGIKKKYIYFVIVYSAFLVSCSYTSNKNKKPNIIIFLVDALRSDDINRQYNSITPNIDSFLKSSYVFMNTYSTATWTRPAVVSLFTGLFAHHHKINSMHTKMNKNLFTLSRALKNHGYYMCSFTTNPNLSPYWKILHGFDYQWTGPNNPYVTIDKVIRRVEQHIDKKKSQPFLCYIHTMDPHAPYNPPKEFLKDMPATYKNEMKYNTRISNNPNPDNEQLLRNLYAGEVRFTDLWFGKSISFLKEKKLYDNTLIVLVSDHGEEFFDHNALGHGINLYNTTLKIVNVIKIPRQKKV